MREDGRMPERKMQKDTQDDDTGSMWKGTLGMWLKIPLGRRQTLLGRYFGEEEGEAVAHG